MISQPQILGNIIWAASCSMALGILAKRMKSDKAPEYPLTNCYAVYFQMNMLAYIIFASITSKPGVSKLAILAFCLSGVASYIYLRLASKLIIKTCISSKKRRSYTRKTNFAAGVMYLFYIALLIFFKKDVIFIHAIYRVCCIVVGALGLTILSIMDGCGRTYLLLSVTLLQSVILVLETFQVVPIVFLRVISSIIYIPCLCYCIPILDEDQILSRGPRMSMTVKQITDQDQQSVITSISESLNNLPSQKNLSHMDEIIIITASETESTLISCAST